MKWPQLVTVPPGTGSREAYLSVAAAWLTFGSAVSIVVNLWFSQLLLWLAVAALIFSGQKLKLPRIKLQLGLFMLGTAISLAFSGEIVHGLPQIRKFLVFLTLLAVFTCLRSKIAVRSIFLAWAVLGAVGGIVGVAQFIMKFDEAREAGIGFRPYYTAERITGFMSHWNTFSEEEMFGFLMLLAFLFFAPSMRKRVWIWIVCAGLLSLALVLAWTRGVWIATIVGALYLVWFWRPKLILLVPVLVVVVWFTPVVGERVQSIMKPEQVDSNSFRIVAWRTGIAMIKSHPILGLGPDGPKFHFMEYVPKDTPRDIHGKLPEGFYEHTHNVYLQYGADRGIPTALIMVWLLIQVIVDFARGLKRLPAVPDTRRFLLHGGIAVVLATMVDGVVEYNLGDSEILTMFLVVVACGYLALEAHALQDAPADSGA